MNVSCHAWNTMKENLKFLVTGIFACFSTLSLKQRALHIRRQAVILCFQGSFQIQGKTGLLVTVMTLLLQAIQHKNSTRPFWPESEVSFFIIFICEL